MILNFEKAFFDKLDKTHPITAHTNGIMKERRKIVIRYYDIKMTNITNQEKRRLNKSCEQLKQDLTQWATIL